MRRDHLLPGAAPAPTAPGPVPSLDHGAGAGAPPCCLDARRELRVLIDRYCAHHGLDPAYPIRFAFDRQRLLLPAAAGVLRVPMSNLVPISDDGAWARFCPCDRAWWDLDLYPVLAVEVGAIGVTRAPARGERRTVAPAGIRVHHDAVTMVR